MTDNSQPSTPNFQVRLFLMGYRGTGKSTVARLLGPKLGWEVVDTDEEVVRRARKPISAIFSEQGEPAFRDLEQQVVADLCGRQEVVVALGGGAILRPASRAHISDAGPVVWLTADAETLATRVASDSVTATQRPRLTDLSTLDEVRQVLAEREPLYRECATLSLATGAKRPEEIADEIACWLTDKI